MNKKKDINIRSYDGQDAFYSGSDAEYEEFLKNAEVRIEQDSAEPVESTQKINLNETINLQNVIDKFRKTAGDLGHTAKLFKDNVASKVDSIKAKTAETAEEEGVDLDAVKETAKEKIQSTVEASKEKLGEIKDELGLAADIPEKIGDVRESVELISKQLEALSSKLSDMESAITEGKKGSDRITVELMETMKGATDNIAEIKQAVGSVAKLNDSVFDLKNTQLNTKNAVSNLETAFARLKKKCVLGVTVLSILSAIVIVLEIVLMLS